MFFAKRRNKNREIPEYFLHRDSLTGLMDRAYAFKAFEKVKHESGWWGVLVKVAGCDNLPMYKAERYIGEAGALLARIVDCDISRIEFGEFIMFTQTGEDVCERLEFFLSQLSDGEKKYITAAVLCDSNESFDLFLRRIRHRMASIEYQML